MCNSAQDEQDFSNDLFRCSNWLTNCSKSQKQDKEKPNLQKKKVNVANWFEEWCDEK